MAETGRMKQWVKTASGASQAATGMREEAAKATPRRR